MKRIIIALIAALLLFAGLRAWAWERMKTDHQTCRIQLGMDKASTDSMPEAELIEGAIRLVACVEERKSPLQRLVGL